MSNVFRLPNENEIVSKGRCHCGEPYEFRVRTDEGPSIATGHSECPRCGNLLMFVCRIPGADGEMPGDYSDPSTEG